MSKIQITTVQKTANIEVIELNSNTVAKIVRAGDAAQALKDAFEKTQPYTDKVDETGKEVCDENGKVIRVVDWNNVDFKHIPTHCLRDVIEKSLPFMIELLEAVLK